MKIILRLACLLLLVAPTLAGAQPAARDQLLLVVNREPKVLSVFKVDGPALTLFKRVPIGKGAREICLTADGNRAYVSNVDDNSITVIDLVSFTVVTTITDPAIAGPDGGIVSPDGKKVYITSPGNDTVVVISSETHKVLKSIPTKGTAARRLVISPDGQKMYVGHNKSPYLSVIDLAKEQVVSQIQVGNECRGGLAFTLDGKLLLNGAVEDDTMYHIDAATGKVVRIVGTPLSPQRIAVTPKGLTLLLAMGAGAGLHFIPNLEKHDSVKTIPLGYKPWCLALNPAGTLAYVSNYGDGTISVVDVEAAKVIGTIPIDKDPNGVAFRK